MLNNFWGVKLEENVDTTEWQDDKINENFQTFSYNK